MPVLRVALAQVDITVGDLAGNAGIILERAVAARTAGADLILFPELAVTGYPPEDLVFRSSFRAASRAALEKLAADLAAGRPRRYRRRHRLRRRGRPDRATRSRSCQGGAVVARYFKHHLPNYGVFDERRYFVPASR